jgi:alpha-beta hydrolase superfamily lysophospholipase
MEGQPFFSFDDYKLHSYELNSDKPKKAVVQMIHGMGEHAGRYETIAKHLESLGFVVFLSDHRAHGKTAESLKEIGVYENDIFYDTVRDQIYISEYLIQKYNLPLIVIGHSFGSFIAQRYHQLYKKHSALVLIGSNSYKNDVSVLLGYALASVFTKIRGHSAPAKLIHNLTFRRYNNQFTDKNWLTTDKNEQKKQKQDRYCNRMFSYNFYKNFFRGISDIFKTKNVANIKKSTPILILSGQKDALNKDGTRIEKLKAFYKENGAKIVQLKVYKNARHELLNETIKEQVYEDIVTFVTEHIEFKEEPKKGKKK